MAIPNLAAVTVEITEIEGAALSQPITVFTDAAFPVINGTADIDVLGESREIPCPTNGVEATVNVDGIGEVTLTIQADLI
ncbi:hypothetical protein [Bacillus sp. FJAT-44742]|uniref:hypothetical protein n=1 Tax=Bacillus sp. FJAT-44742 TaxID=2014005 RepID=UPI000C24A5B3|nr:hypothetical protein [Bacillus sp. FJAT-44742]